MILKVAIYESAGENWFFFGDVTEVSTGCGYFRAERAPVRHADDTGGMPAGKLDVFEDPIAPKAEERDRPIQHDRAFLPLYFSTRVEVLADKGQQAFIKVRTACLTRRNSLPLGIVFHEAYLLNDEGKTIERL